jgi:dipeptide transport system substrate-binding protein
MKRNLLGAVALSAMMALGFTVSAEAKTLVYCSEASPEGFNPQLFTSGTTLDATKPLYNGLVEFITGKTTLKPALAQKWSISDDGLSYTFNLRKGVKFHGSGFTPTRDFNADDVVFSFDRQLNKDNPYAKVSGGTYEYFNDMGMPDIIKSVEKVDDYTVKFTLNHPEAPFLADLAMAFASIQSKEYADAMLKAGTPEKADLNPVGTGPFTLESYQKDAVIRYNAAADYWGGKPKLDKLVFAITPDASVRWAKLKANECQVMPYPNPADVAAMQKDPSIKVLHQEGLNVGYLAFNVEHKPFDDVRVRQAINYAINRDAILKAVYQGAGRKAKNPIPPTIWSYNDAVKDYAYSPTKAKALLAEAGLKDGFKAKLWAMPVQRPYNPNAKLMAEMMQADLKKVGIDVEIVSYEWGEYLKRSKAGEHDMVLLGWTGDNGDPDNFLNQLLSCGAAKDGGNRARWCDKSFDDDVTQAKQTSDIKKRTALYKAAQVEFKAQAPWVTIAHSLVYEPIRTNVKNYKVDPFGLHVFNDVDLQ